MKKLILFILLALISVTVNAQTTRARITSLESIRSTGDSIIGAVSSLGRTTRASFDVINNLIHSSIFPSLASYKRQLIVYDSVQKVTDAAIVTLNQKNMQLEESLKAQSEIIVDLAKKLENIIEVKFNKEIKVDRDNNLYIDPAYFEKIKEVISATKFTITIQPQL